MVPLARLGMQALAALLIIVSAWGAWSVDRRFVAEAFANAERRRFRQTTPTALSRTPRAPKR